MFHLRLDRAVPLLVLLATFATAGANSAIAAGAAAAHAGVQAITQAQPAAAPASAATPNAAQSGPSAPATELIDAAGLRKVLAAQAGKIVVLNLWATWCVPCLREIPDLVAVTRESASRGVVLIGLSMDEPSALAEQVEPFRRNRFPAFRTWLRSTEDMDSLVSVVDPAWNEILPTTYIIGRDGKVVTKVQGKRTLEQFRELVKEVP